MTAYRPGSFGKDRRYMLPGKKIGRKGPLHPQHVGIGGKTVILSAIRNDQGIVKCNLPGIHSLFLPVSQVSASP
jgi:hypothetical protein